MELAGVQGLGRLGRLYVRVGRAVVGHRRVAEAALDDVLAGDAVDEIRVAAAIEQQNRLPAGIDGRAEQAFETLGKEVHAAPAAGLYFHVHQFDGRHRQPAHAAREEEVVVG